MKYKFIKNQFNIGIIMAIIFLSSSCGYQSVKIGEQEWMNENLNVSKFKNGDNIPEVQSIDEWKKALRKGEPAWCYYENDKQNGEKYGKLYNWYAVNDSRGLAPKGWHIPSEREWFRLIDYLGGQKIAGKTLKEEGDKNWTPRNSSSDNSSRFTALPGGYRSPNWRSFGKIGKEASWWSSTHSVSYKAISFKLKSDSKKVYSFISDKRMGLSVRCIKN